MAGLFYHYGFNLTRKAWWKVYGWTSRMVRSHISMLSVLLVSGLLFHGPAYDALRGRQGGGCHERMQAFLYVMY